MRNKSLHIVYIPVSGVGLGLASRRESWLEYRLNIFKEYTLKSLLNQTNREFLLWMSFRPEDREDPTLRGLSYHLESLGMPHVFTFDGLMYWDDKFSKGLKNRAMNVARLLRECWRSKNWGNVGSAVAEMSQDKNATLESRIMISVDQIFDALPSKDIDWVYMTRLDSDDMLSSETIKNIQRVIPKESKAVTIGLGYIYDAPSDTLAEYNPTTNPPFHTIIFPADVFFTAKKHLAYYKDFKSHEDIPRVFTCTKILHRAYCVVTHNIKRQISTQFSHPFTGRLITDKEEKGKILSKFGI